VVVGMECQREREGEAKKERFTIHAAKHAGRMVKGR
jgi:hypothetical protein